jgi:hypothetical protein
MATVEYKFDKEIIANITGFINSNAQVKVGILSNSAHETDSGEFFGMAELGAVHEFGSKSRNIPPRSFLRSTISNRMDDFESYINSNRVAIGKAIAEKGEEEVLNNIGSWWVTAVEDTFEAQGPGWKALNPKYKKQKENKLKKSIKNKKIAPNAQILMTTGALRRSIAHEVVK